MILRRILLPQWIGTLNEFLRYFKNDYVEKKAGYTIRMNPKKVLGYPALALTSLHGSF